ncbi:MAG: PhoH family protein [Phycisphaerales bacterium]
MNDSTRVADRPDAKPDDQVGTRKKHFIVDTNVLIHNPNALFMFDDNEVVVTLAVLEELDNLKRSSDDIGRNARAAIRRLDELRRKGHLVDGVQWNDRGGIVRVALDPPEVCPHLRGGTPDNRIISTAWTLSQQGHRTVFVTKDINARLKADAIGLVAEDFESQKVDAESLYTGYMEITTPGEVIDELYTERQLPIDRLEPFLTRENEHGDPIVDHVVSNQFVQMRDLEDESHTGLARRLADTNHLIPITGPRRPVFGIMARNVQQTMALDLLLDDDIQLVSLIGTAGTGKTLLALAAGMMKVYNEERYDKLLVARPIMPLGRDIGYLPGDKDEKLTAWMQPIFDNLSFLLSTRGSHMNLPESYTTEQRIQRLIADGQLVLEPLTYIRGRSIPHQFMIVDEAQNLTPHEVKTIASRVGDGTKLVLTGDVAQIDNPYLDAESNGLSYLIERMKYEGLTGHCTLQRSERSELASLAVELL